MRRGGVCIRLGLVLIALALGLWGWNLWENHQADTASVQVVQALTAAQLELPPVQPTQPEYVQFPQREMPEQELNGQRYVATLEIPKLGLTLPVISQWSQEGFQIAPCRYLGSAYTGDLLIAAHNYPAHFGRLKELQPGDGVYLTDMEGSRFSYRLLEQEILLGTDVAAMEEGDWDLTLFTCTIGGQYRVTLRFEEV